MAQKLKWIEATFKIVTPMFLGDANEEATRIRETSIKGALAFWWRALNCARFMQTATGNTTAENEANALTLMKEEECHLFGGPEGQGIFLLKVIPVPITPKPKETTQKIGVGLNGAYYFGYGVMNSKGTPKRSYFCQQGCFKVKVIFKPNATVEQCQEMVRVVKVFGLLGGLGARVRRGYGSVCLIKLATNNIEIDDKLKPIPETVPEYEDAIGQIKKDVVGVDNSGSQFPITAFAEETQFKLSPACSSDALQVLDGIGREMQAYRSYGKGGLVNGQKSERNFTIDHDWFKGGGGRPQCGQYRGSGTRDWSVDRLPRRASFGLPHNYFSESGAHGGGNLKMLVEGPDKKKQQRRASPLFVHVHRLGNGQHIGCLLFFPNKFLATQKIKVDGGDRNKKYTFDEKVISDFLSRF